MCTWGFSRAYNEHSWGAGGGGGHCASGAERRDLQRHLPCTYLLLLFPVPALEPPTRRGVVSVGVFEWRGDGQVGHVVPVQLQVCQRGKQTLGCRSIDTIISRQLLEIIS